MQSILNKARQARDGLTLIEMIVVLAILGILAAILVPTLSGVLDQGDQAGLNADTESVGLAVERFKLDFHAGPDGSNEWGLDPSRRLYPTEDGLVGDIEFATSAVDSEFPGNKRIDGFSPGPTTSGTAASDAEITDALVWMGLLVLEPFNQSGAVQQTTGDARPQGGEDGEYVPNFPDSADATNTTRDPSGSYTTGTYSYVVLHNGDVVAVYKNPADGFWYAGFNGTFP